MDSYSREESVEERKTKRLREFVTTYNAFMQVYLKQEPFFPVALRGRSAGRRALPRAGRLAAAGGQKSSYRSRIRG